MCCSSSSSSFFLSLVLLPSNFFFFPLPFSNAQQYGGFIPSHWPYLSSSSFSVPSFFGRSAFARGVEHGLGSFSVPASFQQTPSSSVPYYGDRRMALGAMNNYASSPFLGNPNFLPVLRGFHHPSHFSGSPFHPFYATSHFLRQSVYDRDNFQARGCGWEPSGGMCADVLGMCKGGCEDFSRDGGLLLHDCRCVPIGYSALIMGRRRRR